MGVVNHLRDWLPRPGRAIGNRERGCIEVKAQGQTWILRLNLNHLVSLCERLEVEDEDMAIVIVKLASKIDTLKGRRTAWAFALREHHPEVTDEVAGELITAVGYYQSGNLIIEALRWAMPPESKEDAEKGAAERGKGDDVPGGVTSS